MDLHFTVVFEPDANGTQPKPIFRVYAAERVCPAERQAGVVATAAVCANAVFYGKNRDNFTLQELADETPPEVRSAAAGFDGAEGEDVTEEFYAEYENFWEREKQRNLAEKREEEANWQGHKDELAEMRAA